MCRWVDYIRAYGEEEYLWLGGAWYGDWLALDAGEDSYIGATSRDLLASAFFAYSTALAVSAGEVLGRDVTKYKVLYENVRSAFREKYLKDILSCDIGELSINDTKGGILTQTAMVLILYFNLCTEEERPRITDILVRLIELFNNRMSTGFVGTPYILHALSDNGRTDIAYSLLFCERSPSWLYSVNLGATTMWEHWNGIKEDGSFWSTEMNSFNHYAYGAVGDWLYGVSAGIRVIDAGYKQVSVEPMPDRRLGFVDCSVITPRGEVKSAWKYDGDRINFDVSVPAGVLAKIKLPNGFISEICGPASLKKEIIF